MNLTFLATRASASVATCSLGLLAMAAPADALQLTGSIGISSTGSPTVTATEISFGPGTVDNGSGILADLIGNNPTVKPILGLTEPTTDIGPLASFIDFGNVTLGSKSRALVFDLTSATVNTFTSDISVVNFSLNMLGVFRFGESTLAKGTLTAESTAGASAWGITLAAQPDEPEPIPTPALLPGLVGLGVATLRRKNGEADDQT